MQMQVLPKEHVSGHLLVELFLADHELLISPNGHHEQDVVSWRQGRLDEIKLSWKYILLTEWLYLLDDDPLQELFELPVLVVEAEPREVVLQEGLS